MTKIEWTDETWNPITGCDKISPGCANCYAARMAKRLAGRHGYPPAPHEFDVTLHPDRLDRPLRWKKPRMIFVCSMSDFFHRAVPLEFQCRIFSVIQKCPQHTFQILTKRADQMAMMEHACGLPVLPNLWLGVSVENQEAADERIPLLLQVPAAVRFVSLEPLLGPVDVSPFLPQMCAAHHMRHPGGRDCVRPRDDQPTCLDWVICGGESGPGARPMQPSWARDIIRQCAEADTPCFVKQMGGNWASLYKVRRFPYLSVRQVGDTKGAKMEYWPEDLRVREMPEVTR